MKNIAIIGLGVISQYYLKAIEKSQGFNLIAVCDKNQDAYSKQLYSKYSYYDDYIKMIESEKPDFVLISTPPKTHYDIAKTCLVKGVSVITEKPAVLNLADYDDLTKTAQQNGVTFEVMFHFQSASETLKFLEKYDTNKISDIKVFIKDFYSDDGKSIRKDRVGLNGAWLDSGVNALSLVGKLLKMDSVEIIQAKKILCESSYLPIYSLANFMIDKVTVSIEIDWRNAVNQKVSYLIYDGKQMTLDSSNQLITFDGKTEICSTETRLQTHYDNYFKYYEKIKVSNNARKIHQILFETNGIL